MGSISIGILAMATGTNTTFSNTNSHDPYSKTQPPPLAMYKSLHEYQPKYGDYVVWSGWFSTWHGFVIGWSTEEVRVVFAGVPYLLMTIDPDGYDRETRYLKLAEVRNSLRGKYAIQQHQDQNAIWFI